MFLHYAYVLLGDLHSFPTRRSSDLEKADYYRWFFYAAGPVEAAVSNQAMGWQVPAERERMFGYGNFDRAIAVVDELFTLRDYVRSEEHTSELQSRGHLVCRLLLEKK